MRSLGLSVVCDARGKIYRIIFLHRDPCRQRAQVRRQIRLCRVDKEGIAVNGCAALKVNAVEELFSCYLSQGHVERECRGLGAQGKGFHVVIRAIADDRHVGPVFRGRLPGDRHGQRRCFPRSGKLLC